MSLPVIILAGGLAQRLRPLTDKIPKAMLEICQKPFIEWQIKLLRSRGISQIVLCVGYLGEMIEKFVGDGSQFGVGIRYSYDGNTLLKTGGAIKKALKYIDSSFFVLYGDSYLTIDYQAVQNAYINSGKKGLMTIYKNNNQFDKSNVVFKNGQIAAYSKKQVLDDMDYIDYGLGILNKDEFLNEKRDIFDLADIYEKLAQKNQLTGYEVFERFYEIGSKCGIKELEDFLNGQTNAK
ncbi:MAG: NTP transferase domain-containing protein [Elusimicrobiota bacterium]|jgi:NDP-sugar pyrophosphorylase family protein|nr:NTP transferase domain-containing protein [Elusimicrobiota bacterium]